MAIKQTRKNLSAALLLLILLLSASQVYALSGAIWTTDKDGNLVNGNIYEHQEDVYLNGGPNNNNHRTLPDGAYYFQVTDPSGAALLTAEPPRTVTVANGVFTLVQLAPFANTPNSGGEYKVWLTPVDAYRPGEGVWGFLPSNCKTDNFKVLSKDQPVPPYLTVKKFRDCNADGVWDLEEEEIEGWAVDIRNPEGATSRYYTPLEIAVSAGVWEGQELVKDDWQHTASILDGLLLPLEPSVLVTVAGASRETHEVIFGNIPLGTVKACKFYDLNGNGEKDPGEPPVAGIRFTLTGTDVTAPMLDDGTVPPNVARTEYTCDDGCVVFAHLLPGVYTLAEVLPTNCNWRATTLAVQEGIVVTCDEPTVQSFDFGNICVGTAAFGTKGYWHNKNGLAEIAPADITNLNGLAPYSSPSSYFGAGDEPFNGKFADGANVAAAFNTKVLLAPAGSTLAEISQFLVDRNANGDPREQLAQQLLAFILNVAHRLPGAGIFIQVPDGTWATAQSIIDGALSAWSGGIPDQNSTAVLLDQLNNNGTLEYILPTPCPVIYPVP